MKVRIVEVIIRGFHRVGWQDFGIKKELFVKYKVNKQLDHYDYSGGDEVESKKVFATKELLLKSI